MTLVPFIKHRFFLVFIWIFVMKKPGKMHNIERQNHKTVHLERQTGWIRRTHAAETHNKCS